MRAVEPALTADRHTTPSCCLPPLADICCPFNAPECKVQTGYSVSKQYFDFTNNRCVARLQRRQTARRARHLPLTARSRSTATFYSNGVGVVALFNDGKEYEVNSQGACQSYCPIEGGMLRT